MMGINVRTDSRAGIDYAGLIVTGRKTLETRATDSLAAYLGRRVAIVRTGAGPARAIGSVRIVGAYRVDGPRFRTLERLHAVAQHHAIVVCALGIDVEHGTESWLRPRPTDAFWLQLFDSVVPGVPPRVVEPPRFDARLHRLAGEW